ncbi:hypothetical protein BAGA_29090 [Bacillus gaemokensis]|uniref:Uncharacterized protein n=1 Tax=Bacillus gaemokensis TaxID=574375 RepID=A0A073KC02_9BACI|nr:hypothetical protein BAGA_29090 [Bacillus gaemokensis]KYG32744.1 hypothetical protein AZF08_11700 [Bacillus gaemokensis]
MKDKEKIDYVKDLPVEGLKGKKIGILFSMDQQDKARKAVAEKIKQDLQNAGATLTEGIKLNHDGVDNLSILEYDFKHNLNSFLANQKNVPVKSLKEIIEFNKKDENRRKSRERVKARLVKANNQWGVKKTPLIKVSLYVPLYKCKEGLYDLARRQCT